MNISTFQAGRYEQRLEYKAFLAESVCHEWVVSYSELTDLLGRVDRVDRVDRFGIEIFDDRLIAVDKFHHVSTHPDNRLSEH